MINYDLNPDDNIYIYPWALRFYNFAISSYKA